MLEKIKTYMRQHKWDAVLIGVANSYLTESVLPEENRLQRVSGFTGSSGLALIGTDENVLFVDGRYTLQAKEQAPLFHVFEVPAETTVATFLKEHYVGKTVAYDPALHSAFWVQKMKERVAGVALVAMPENVVDLFSGQSQICLEENVADYPVLYAGQSVAEKVKTVADLVAQNGWQAYVFFDPESASWLLNIRGDLVPYTPVALRRVVVFADGTYRVFEREVPDLTGLKVATDFTSMPDIFLSKMPADVCDSPDLIADLKAVKTPAQRVHIATGCWEESKTLCRFLAWLEEHKMHLTEYDCAVKLQQLRAENPLYKGDSFEPIVASGPHAALPHYQPKKGEKVFLREAPLTLIDTGGQYLNATTDMTRTICITSPTDEMKKRYTQVLKGHIAVACSEMPQGDLPDVLDAKARSFLQADGVNYTHATGHGIGMYLSVHEHPPIIAATSKTPLKEGMVFSNEPGYYKENAFGIRLENMLLACRTENNYLYFENLIFVPFDGRLIDFSMLTVPEKDWLTQYHSFIMVKILPELTEKERSFFNPLIDFFV